MHRYQLLGLEHIFLEGGNSTYYNIYYFYSLKNDQYSWFWISLPFYLILNRTGCYFHHYKLAAMIKVTNDALIDKFFKHFFLSSPEIYFSTEFWREWKGMEGKETDIDIDWLPPAHDLTDNPGRCP